MKMIFREATIQDIPQIQAVRNAVKENTLSNPALVSDKDCEEFMFERGKGWVCEINQTIVGFSIADLKEHNIWALFVDPVVEKQGIGKKLHDLMLNWYFTQTQQTVWLGTAPNTRAEKFYSHCGWKNVGVVNKGEVKFEMTYEDYRKIYKSF
jgi:GNAT superfamily N-acetyltransferase